MFNHFFRDFGAGSEPDISPEQNQTGFYVKWPGIGGQVNFGGFFSWIFRDIPGGFARSAPAQDRVAGRARWVACLKAALEGDED